MLNVVFSASLDINSSTSLSQPRLALKMTQE
jgi:hypothetical protein